MKNIPPPYDRLFPLEHTEHSRLDLLSLDFESFCASHMLRHRPPRHGQHCSTKPFDCAFSVLLLRFVVWVSQSISVDDPTIILMWAPTQPAPNMLLRSILHQLFPDCYSTIVGTFSLRWRLFSSVFLAHTFESMP